VRESIERFLDLGLPVLGPCPPERLVRLAEEVEAEVPEPVAQLYRAFGGLGDGASFPMRLMPPDEVVETHALLRDQAEYLQPDPEVRYFWCDDNSNFAGVFVAGPLAGTVCFLDHDEPCAVPRYRTVARFFDRCTEARAAGHDWYDMPTDYPAPGAELAEPWRSEDRALVARLRESLAHAEVDPERRVLTALQILQLTPPEDIAELVGFLDDERPWVQETACRMMGLRDYHPAIPRLAEIVRADQSNNPVIASIGALARMTAPEARPLLVALKGEIDEGFDIYFPDDLA